MAIDTSLSPKQTMKDSLKDCNILMDTKLLQYPFSLYSLPVTSHGLIAPCLKLTANGFLVILFLNGMFIEMNIG